MHDPQDSPSSVTYTPIGTIHSPFHDIAGMPIQPNGSRGTTGSIDLYEPYAEGLRDLAGFERIILIYAFHRCTGPCLTVTPFLDTTPRGVFATRSPKRPNAIGLSVVRLLEVNGTTLKIEDVDVLDGTPLLDIKPYVPAFDAYPGSRCGWLETVAGNAGTARSDDRFR
jgi:tRNA (adenine37-N6)-methyltransferase